MIPFFTEQLTFIAILFILLILPGWFFLRGIFPEDQFTKIEKLILSVPLSFSVITLIILCVDYFSVPLTPQNMIFAISGITLFFILLRHVHKKNIDHTQNHIFTFSRNQLYLIATLIIFMIVAKSLFLINTIFPTATDLGHHMFWVEKITQEQVLPDYQKIKVITDSGALHLSEPNPIADFIVGEHIIFSVVQSLTKMSTVSTFPSLILFVVSIFSVLTIFIFVRRVFARYRYGALIAITSLLFLGPLWAISGAGAKFVSGGVIGNIFGNLLIPALLYFLYRAFAEKNATLLIPSIILVTTLAYTHHLSTFIFGYIFVFSIVAFVFFQKDGFTGYKKLFLLLKNYYVLPLLAIALGALFFFNPPSYLDPETISSSVGAPSKSTRTGVPFGQLLHMLGEARFVLGVIGLMIFGVFALLIRFNYCEKFSKKSLPANAVGTAFLIGWGTALLGMSMFPHVLKVNIISTRIATYAAFPLAIFASFAIVWMISVTRAKKNHALYFPQSLFFVFLLFIFSYSMISGIRDNATSMNDAPKTNKALQTFHVGTYAAETFGDQAKSGNFWLVKDHNYITSDTWIKVFFAYDYSYPLSRSFFKRYETNPNRERCTLNMISDPFTEESQNCYDALRTHAVLVDTEEDASQFLSSEQFYRIYQNDSVSLFIRK